MDIGSTYSSGLQGFQAASGQISQESVNINRQTTLGADSQRAEHQQSKSLESSVVNLTSELTNAQANVRSIETADEVLGSIIDIRV
jgi:flagellar hook protein FlgE